MPSGRIPLIIILVLVSSSCFMLGYFVGRATGPKAPPPQPAAYAPEGREEAADVPPPMSEEALGQVMEEERAPEPAAPAPAARTKSEPKATPASPVSRQLKPEAKPVKPAAKPGPPAPATQKAAPAPAQTPVTQKGGTYNVQVGAFTTLTDAAKAKETFASKGYNAYIFRDAGKDGGSIFKVRLGDYTSVEDARAVADKLYKSDHIQAFVTGGK